LHPSFDASSPPGCCLQSHGLLLIRVMKYRDSELNAPCSRTSITTVHIAAAVIGWRIMYAISSNCCCGWLYACGNSIWNLVMLLQIFSECLNWNVVCWFFESYSIVCHWNHQL
jgi:hypothetical protein